MRTALLLVVLLSTLAPCFAQEPKAELTLERALLDAARQGDIELVIEAEALQVLRATKLMVHRAAVTARIRVEALLRLADLPYEAVAGEGSLVFVVRARTTAPAPSSPRMGVVDMGKVFEAHPRREAHEAALNARRAQLKLALEAEAEAIQGRRGRLDGIDRQADAAAWERLKTEVAEAQQALERGREAAQRELRSLVESDTRELLADIERAVAEVARRDGLVLVLWREDLAQARQVGRDGPVVLFADATLDVTPAVIASLSPGTPAPTTPQRGEY